MKFSKEFKIYFGNTIRLIRDLCEITQRELCEKSGLKMSQLSSIERGVKKLSFQNVQCLAKALDIKYTAPKHDE